MAKPSQISVSPTSGQNNGSIQVTAAKNTNIDNRSKIPDGDKVIIRVSGPSAEDFIIYYVNAAI